MQVQESETEGGGLPLAKPAPSVVLEKAKTVVFLYTLSGLLTLLQSGQHSKATCVSVGPFKATGKIQSVAGGMRDVATKASMQEECQSSQSTGLILLSLGDWLTGVLSAGRSGCGETKGGGNGADRILPTRFFM